MVKWGVKSAEAQNPASVQFPLKDSHRTLPRWVKGRIKIKLEGSLPQTDLAPAFLSQKFMAKAGSHGRL